MISRLAIVIATVSTACSPTLDDFGPFPTVSCESDPGNPGCGLRVEGTYSRVLKRDTLRVFTRAAAGPVAPVTWSISGGEIVEQSEQGSSALIRSANVGTMVVTATYSPTRTATSSFTVADSTIISRMMVSSNRSSATDYSQPTTTTVRVGDSLWVNATLLDAGGYDYGADPERWTPSDTTIATTVAHDAHPSIGGKARRVWIVGRAPGTVDVEATFLAVKASLRITVVQ